MLYLLTRFKPNEAPNVGLLIEWWPYPNNYLQITITVTLQLVINDLLWPFDGNVIQVTDNLVRHLTVIITEWQMWRWNDISNDVMLSDKRLCLKVNLYCGLNWQKNILSVLFYHRIFQQRTLFHVEDKRNHPVCLHIDNRPIVSRPDSYVC